LALETRDHFALEHAPAFFDTQIGEPPLDLRGDDRLRRATTYPDPVSSGVPEGAPPDLSTRGVVVSTSVAAKTRSHQKVVLAATTNTSTAMTTHGPRRERGGSASRRSEASSFLRSP
jgi:hypothetical protein